jgi:hypothetical protein
MRLTHILLRSQVPEPGIARVALTPLKSSPKLHAQDIYREYEMRRPEDVSGYFSKADAFEFFEKAKP